MSEEINDAYIIEPWDHLMMTEAADGSLIDGVHDQYVPPELESLARQVMERYEMSVSDMLLITAKPDKGGAIWRIATNHGPRSIKVLHRTPNRSLFSIGAQDYLVQQGARVPPLIPTRNGELYVTAGGKAWIVTEWIEPLEPVSKIDMTGVRDLCRGLGEFHRWSREYVPPFGAVKASRLYRWPQHYEKIIAKLQWFRDIAEMYEEFPASQQLLNILPQVRTEAADYYTMFRDSAYRRMTAMGEPHWGLAHQDYGWSNGQMGPGGIWIIDLDGVAYDIPIRDLRKLITSTMVDNGSWDINWVRGMIEAYHEGNPIDRETFELLWIDMAFPNEFYKHVKEIVYEPELFIQLDLEGILTTIRAVEANKWDVLHELRRDMEQYPAGSYTEAEEPAPFVIPIALPGAAAAQTSLPAWAAEAVPLADPLAAAVIPAASIGHAAAAAVADSFAEGYTGAASADPAAPFFPMAGARIGTPRRTPRRRRRHARAMRRRKAVSGRRTGARRLRGNAGRTRRNGSPSTMHSGRTQTGTRTRSLSGSRVGNRSGRRSSGANGSRVLDRTGRSRARRTTRSRLRSVFMNRSVRSLRSRQRRDRSMRAPGSSRVVSRRPAATRAAMRASSSDRRRRGAAAG